MLRQAAKPSGQGDLIFLVNRYSRNLSKQGFATRFFQVFGCNPLAIFVWSDLLLIPFGIYNLLGDTSIHQFLYDTCYCSIFGDKFASLLYSITYVLINWAFGLYLFKKKIYIKL